MKKLTVLLLSAAAVLSASCAKDKAAPTKDGRGVLTVRIKSDKPASRAILDGTVLTAANVDAFEKRVTDFSAYVFDWDTGDLEGKATSADGSPAVITGLNTAGLKRVLVIANTAQIPAGNSSIPAFENDPNYSRLASGYLALADQSFTDFTSTTQGFVMTGENSAGKQLSVDENYIDIEVKRVVAKVQLGQLSFDRNVQLVDLAKFSLESAGIQRAASYSNLVSGDITTPATPVPSWVGAYLGGSVTTVQNAALGNADLGVNAFLLDLFTTKLGYTGLDDASISGSLGDALLAKGLTDADVTYTPNAFWYVLPQGGVNFTLLTLKGQYEAVDYFYPIELNDADADVTGDAALLNNYIKRNTIYTLNVKFRNFTGTQNPDLPGEVASLEVTVIPADWAGPVVQNVTW